MGVIMSLTLITGGAIGTSLSGGGLFALRQAWTKRQNQTERQMRRNLTLLGWGGILLALIIWSLSAGGADRGVAWGIIIVSIQALFFIAYSAAQDKTPRKAVKPVKIRDQTAQSKITFILILKRCGTFLLASVLCGTVAFLTALGLHEIMGLAGAHASNSLVTALFFFPIIWAALASFVLITQSRRLRWSVLLGCALIAGLLLFLGNGGLV